jgi:hypothetical protein
MTGFRLSNHLYLDCIRVNSVSIRAEKAIAYLDPFGMKGKFGTGLIWFEPLPDLVTDFNLRNQTGFEAYWKMLLTPNLSITPESNSFLTRQRIPAKISLPSPTLNPDWLYDELKHESLETV